MIVNNIIKLNSKYEILNTKRNSNDSNSKFQTVWGIGKLGIRICFACLPCLPIGRRQAGISNLGFRI